MDDTVEAYERLNHGDWVEIAADGLSKSRKVVVEDVFDNYVTVAGVGRGFGFLRKRDGVVTYQPTPLTSERRVTGLIIYRRRGDTVKR